MDDVGRARWAGLAAVVLTGALIAGAVVATRGTAAPRDPVAAAVDSLPAGVVSLDVTVWSRVDGDLDTASLRDVTTRSVVAGPSDELAEQLGWSVRDTDWEAFTTTATGPVVVLGLGDVDADDVAAGWGDVATSDGDDTWTIDSAQVGPEVGTLFERVRLLRSRHLLVAGAPESVESAVAAIEGGEPSVLDERGVADVVRALDAPASVLVQARGAVCATTVDGDDADALTRVEAASGRLADPVWTARALTDSRPQRLAFVASFESPAEARGQLTAREPLTTGPFLGRVGDVEESLVDLRARVDGSVLVQDFRLTPDAESFMTDTGPVVLNGCRP